MPEKFIKKWIAEGFNVIVSKYADRFLSKYESESVQSRLGPINFSRHSSQRP